MPTPATRPQPRVAIIGGGPAGLMAAEVLSQANIQVDVYEAKPSVGRKFLFAGKSGMNLTHAEALDAFCARYGTRQAEVTQWLDNFGPQQLRDWASGLGIDTFVGSSGRVFPTDMKAAPLLRAWVHRLKHQGVRFHVRHRWLPWSQAPTTQPTILAFATENGPQSVEADAVVLALGGGSWARLGSDGAWLTPLSTLGIATQPLRPANCGFNVSWSPHFIERFAGQPLKTVSASAPQSDRHATPKQGEFIITREGVEGSLIYAMSAALRDALEVHGHAILQLDLLPDWSSEKVFKAVAHPRGARSLSSHLKSRLKLDGVKMGLLRECLSEPTLQDPAQLAVAIKALPITLTVTRPIDEAISTAGGIDFAALDATLMLEQAPGVFCAGEMIDWEAPTGGYLLTACFASGVTAAQGVIRWLK